MLALISLGVVIAAGVVNWYNGRQTAQVQASIAALEAKRAGIFADDLAQRRLLVFEYISDFRSLVALELKARDEVATSLAGSLGEARSILERRFGSNEDDCFLQALREMELALGKVQGERAYLRFLLDTMAIDSTGVDLEQALPDASTLSLPDDFPWHGSLLDIGDNKPEQLHGYRIKYLDGPADGRSLGARGMVVSVDYDSRTAAVSYTAGALLAAGLEYELRPLEAIVRERRPGQIELDFRGRSLVLSNAGMFMPNADIGDRMTVYPAAWTLEQITRPPRKTGLLVSITPRVNATRTSWSPIFLAFEPSMAEPLVTAYKHLEEAATLRQSWHVTALDDGRLGFSLGEVTLTTRPDMALDALRLESVAIAVPTLGITVSFHAQLHAFIPGSGDDDRGQRTLFPKFIQALYVELGKARSMQLQRINAVRLRKLSIVYEDQVEYLQALSSCGFMPSAIGEDGWVEGTITQPQTPAWLLEAVNGPERNRLRAVGNEAEWKVLGSEWISAELGLLRLRLKGRAPRDAGVSALDIARIELAGEGLQQETLRNTLENAIIGKFTSAAVLDMMTVRSGKVVAHQHAGQEAVHALLRNEQPVVAIWGPPGTGKTTILVKWLLSLFDPADENAWPSVLITGPTHVAVTKLVVDLLRKAQWLERHVVRYGRVEHIEGTGLEGVGNEALLAPFAGDTEPDAATDELLKRWHRVIRTREGRESVAKWMLGSRYIHAATCIGMARRDFGLSQRDFDIVIIDEAGKAFDAEILIPAARARRLILVGDHYQLPPTVTSEVLHEDIGYRLPLAEVEELLKRNCFQDLFEQLPVEHKGMLTLQFRMHQDIGNLVGALFYEGRLQSYRKEGDWTLSTHRIVFIDFSAVPAYRHKTDPNTKSQQNATEISSLTALLARLQETGRAVGKNVLVICPYKRQRAAAERAVSRMNIDFGVEVTTVDAVQGGEADIVFLLMTRSSGRVEFLLDRNRVNVALSRARDAVYILGHRECLSPNGEGPIADLINMGLEQRTLRLIRPEGNPHHKQLARTLFPPGIDKPARNVHVIQTDECCAPSEPV